MLGIVNQENSPRSIDLPREHLLAAATEVAEAAVEAQRVRAPPRSRARRGKADTHRIDTQQNLTSSIPNTKGRVMRTRWLKISYKGIKDCRRITTIQPMEI